MKLNYRTVGGTRCAMTQDAAVRLRKVGAMRQLTEPDNELTKKPFALHGYFDFRSFIILHTTVSRASLFLRGPLQLSDPLGYGQSRGLLNATGNTSRRSHMLHAE